MNKLLNKLLIVLFLTVSFNSFAFVHTYIFVKPNYGMGGLIEFYECEENSYTYTMTYDGNAVTLNDFPFTGQTGVKTLTFTATETATSNTYTFSADIDFNGNSPSITYNTQPATLPLSVIETFMPPTGGCDGEIELLVNGGYAPVNINWIQPSTLIGANPTGLCSGIYQYSVSDNYSFCGMGTPLVRTIELDDFMCDILVTEPSCPESCDGVGELVPVAGNNAVIMTELIEQDNSTTHPVMLSGLCDGNNLLGTMFHLSGQQAFCNAVVVGPDELEFTLDTIDVTVQGADDGNAAANITSGAQPHTFEWTGPNGFNETGSNSISDLVPGTYTLTIGYNDGCDSTITFTIEDGAATSGIEKFENDFNIYPQPFVNELTIVGDKIKSITVFNTLGAEIHVMSKINSDKVTMNLNHLNKGVYFIKINGNDYSTTQKVIKH